MAKYAFQRQLRGLGSTPSWFDAEIFTDRDKALGFRDREMAQQKARIAGRGGSSYTMERVQPTRVVEIID